MLRQRLEGEGVDARELDAIEAAVHAELEEMERRGLAAPFPEPRPRREFKE